LGRDWELVLKLALVDTSFLHFEVYLFGEAKGCQWQSAVLRSTLMSIAGPEDGL
jgi:hypothetical protein